MGNKNKQKRKIGMGWLIWGTHMDLKKDIKMIDISSYVNRKEKEQMKSENYLQEWREEIIYEDSSTGVEWYDKRKKEREEMLKALSIVPKEKVEDGLGMFFKKGFYLTWAGLKLVFWKGSTAVLSSLMAGGHGYNVPNVPKIGETDLMKYSGSMAVSAVKFGGAALVQTTAKIWNETPFWVWLALGGWQYSAFKINEKLPLLKDARPYLRWITKIPIIGTLTKPITMPLIYAANFKVPTPTSVAFGIGKMVMNGAINKIGGAGSKLLGREGNIALMNDPNAQLFVMKVNDQKSVYLSPEQFEKVKEVIHTVGIDKITEAEKLKLLEFAPSVSKENLLKAVTKVVSNRNEMLSSKKYEINQQNLEDLLRDSEIPKIAPEKIDLPSSIPIEKLNEQFEMLQNELNNVNEQVSGSGIGSWIVYTIIGTVVATTVFILAHSFLEKNFEINLFDNCNKVFKYSSEKLGYGANIIGKYFKRMWNRGEQSTIENLTKTGWIKDGGDSPELKELKKDVFIESVDDSSIGEGRQELELQLQLDKINIELELMEQKKGRNKSMVKIKYSFFYLFRYNISLNFWLKL